MKKNLLKKVLALALSATMALTPVVSYAGEEVIEEVVWEETAGDEAGEVQNSGDEQNEEQNSGEEQNYGEETGSEEQLFSEEQSYSGNEENGVDEETVGFEENEEDSASDDAFYAFEGDVTEEENEVDFVTEDAYYAENQDVYEAISEEETVTDDASLFGEDALLNETSVVEAQVVSDEAAYGADGDTVQDTNNHVASAVVGGSTKYYTTLGAAVTACDANETVTLLANVDLNEEITIEKNLTITSPANAERNFTVTSKEGPETAGFIVKLECDVTFDKVDIHVKGKSGIQIGIFGGGIHMKGRFIIQMERSLLMSMGNRILLVNAE